MVTVNNLLGENSGTAEMELKGLSTDTKPTGEFSGYNIGVNSIFIELDTGNVFYYNGSAWAVMRTGGGGGAGLPAVTADDNGKVLGVVEGAWGKMELPESGDSELPAVTGADNGKVLTVVNGAWAAEAQAEPPIYINDYKVTFAQDAQNVITADKSIADIRAAARDGMNVYGVMDRGSAIAKLPLTAYGEGIAEFCGVIMSFEDNTWTPKAVGLIGMVLNDVDDWAMG